MDAIRATRPSVLTIGEIQGAGLTSEHVGERATVTGVVTQLRNNGFYMQADKSEKAAGSRGIFVYTGHEPPTVKKFSRVEVTGDVTEFVLETAKNDQPNTQLAGRLTIKTLETDLDLDTVIGKPTLIGKGGIKPPQVKATDGISFWEGFEGQRVTIKDALVVGPTNYGKFVVVGDLGAQATNVNKGNELIQSALDDDQPEAIAVKVVPSKVTSQVELDAIRTPRLKVGDKIPGEITGIVTFDHGAYVLETEAIPQVVEGPPVTFTNPFKASDTEMLIASMNCENLDPTDPIERFDTIAKKVVQHYGMPDVVALQEIQDDDGPADTGTTSGKLTGKMLCDAIVRAGGPKYRYIEVEPQNNKDGGEPGGNIRCAMLVREDRMEVDEKSIRRIGDEDANTWDRTRKTLEVHMTFKPTGKKIALFNNHLSSKYGTESVWGQHQPPHDPTAPKRTLQNKEVDARMIEVAESDPDIAVIGVGDYNESGLQTVKNTEAKVRAKIQNLAAAQNDDEDRSYNFGGSSITIDQVKAYKTTRAKFVVDGSNARLPFGHPDRDSDHGHTLVLVDMRVSKSRAKFRAA